MKCPECGFECLPDDIECLACGVDIAAAVKNQEKERIRSKEAIERKKQYEIELKKELGLVPEDQGAAKATPEKNGKTLAETFKQVPKCPKCGVNRIEGALDCPRCGVIYDKYKFAGNAAQTPQNATPKPPPGPMPTLKKQPQDVQADFPKQRTLTDTQHEVKKEHNEPEVVIDDIKLEDLRLETEDERVSLLQVEPGQAGGGGEFEKTDEIDISQLEMVTEDTHGANETVQPGPASDVEAEKPEVADNSAVGAEDTQGEDDVVPDESGTEKRGGVSAELTDNAVEETLADGNKVDTVDQENVLTPDEDVEGAADEESVEPEEAVAGAADHEETLISVEDLEESVAEETVEPEGEALTTVDDVDEDAAAEGTDEPEKLAGDPGGAEEANTVVEETTAEEISGPVDPMPSSGDQNETPSEIGDLQETASGTDAEPEQSESALAIEEGETPVAATEGESFDSVENLGLEASVSDVEPRMVEVDDLTPDDNEKTEIVFLDQHLADHESVIKKESKDKAGKASAIVGYLATVKDKSKVYVNNAFQAQKQISVKIKAIAGITVFLVVALSVSIPIAVKYYKAAEAERIEREYYEALEKIRVDFITNRDEITRDIKILINEKQFDKANEAIDQYNIDSLQAELAPVKSYLKEIMLYEQVKKIPATKYQDNYLMFEELLALNPESKLYNTKRDYYKQKYAASEYRKASDYLKKKKKNIKDLSLSIESINTAITLKPNSGSYKKLRKKLLTEKLLFYEGNDTLVMAVKDGGMGKKLFSGQRKMTVWLKNISPETVYINVKYFTMIGQNNKKYTYNDIGRRFKGKLLPGEQTRGELYFRTRQKPDKIVFSHLTKGDVVREFP